MLTPFVGRDAELALLMARWAQVQSGWGQVVLISGEPGIGKSRLVREFSEQVQQQTEAASIVFHCSPQATQSPLYPIITYIRQRLGCQRDVPEAQRLDTLEQLLRSYALPLDETVPFIAALLNLPLPSERYAPSTLSAQRQRQRTQEVLMAWLMAEAERHPVAAVFENLHWADPSTLELIGLFLEGVQTLKVLTVLTYRPAFKPPWPICSPFTELVLPRLDANAITTIIAELAQGKALPVAVMQHVVDRTDGVPLFAEECAKMLLEGDWLKENANHYALARPLPAHDIPVTLQDTLLARLDRLTPGAEVAHLGAVCGREFTRELLQAIAPFDEATVERSLTQLVETELLYQVGFRAPLRYRFKHALIQEVAYQSLLRRQRRQVHQAIVEALETQFPETWQNQPELIAHHYTEAGQVEPAVVHWQRAGEAAIARSAHAEAIAHFNQGLAVLAGLSNPSDRIRHEIALQIALGTPLAATKGYGAPEVERVYTRARELCQQLGDTPQRFPVLSALALYDLVRGAARDVWALGQQLVQLAEQTQAPEHLLEANYLYGVASYWCGEVVLAHRHIEITIAQYDLEQHRDLVFCYGEDPHIQPVFYRALILWLMGYPEEAQRQHEIALTRAQATASPHNLAFALQFSANFYCFCRAPRLAQAQAEAVIALATEQGFPQWIGSGRVVRGWAQAVQGLGEDGIAELQQGMSAYQATGAQVGLTWIAMLFIEAYMHLGAFEAAWQVLAEVQADIEHRGERFCEAELHRLYGDLLLLQDDTQGKAVEALCCRALDVARQQRTKAWELRTAMSLSRLWQSQGKRSEARSLLTEVYEGFTEGFDTADLQAAKALLGEYDDIEF